MIQLNGTPIRDFGMFVLQEGDGHPTPSFSTKSVKVPGQPGEIYFGNEISVRSHTIPLGILESTQMDSQQKFRAFLEEAVDEHGNPKEMELIYDYEPDKYYKVRLSGNFSPTRTFNYINGSIELVAFDPHAHSIVQADDLTWGNEELTFQSYYLLGHEGVPSKTHIRGKKTFFLENDGYAIKPVIQISGKADNLTLDDGKRSFTLDNFSDAEWMINGNNYTVTKDGQNAFAQMQGDFLWLNRGQNTITVTGNNIDANVYIKFRDQYL